MAFPLLIILDSTIKIYSVFLVDDVTKGIDDFHIGLSSVVRGIFENHKFSVNFQ